jgi:hypothetical protein
MEYLNIGPCPGDEDCIQVGSPNYRKNARVEMSQFIEAIRQKCGPEPEGAELVIKWFPHDSGTYGEVCCNYEEGNDKAEEYAYLVEGDSPLTWEEVNMKRPRFDDPEFEKEELIEVPKDGKQYLSPIPDECDMKDRNTKCEGKIKNSFVDGAAIFGPWANMCENCHAQFGRGLGLGVGQLYKRAKDGNFYKV